MSSASIKIRSDRSLLKIRRTKIVATLGPASDQPEVLEKLIDAGVDVFRLNMSHGTQEGHAAVYQRVRAAAEKSGRPIAVLADLCGPKIRVGKFAGGAIELVAGEEAVVTVRDVQGQPGLIPSQYGELADDVRAGDRILLDDGNLELRVLGTQGEDVRCQVVVGGRLSDKKGMNLPGVALSAPALTDKDRADARFALDLGVDLIALSFVRQASDVEALRQLMQEHDQQAFIIAKIEKPEALANIEAILDISDGIMVARGDLGVELPPQGVPAIQDQLVDLARRKEKPVIVATQMLESMIENPRPTRAEVSDVSTAVRSGADAVMLSAETAAGLYPVRAVEMMNLVAREMEAYLWERCAFHDLTYDQRESSLPPLTFEQACGAATAQLSRDLIVRAVVVISMAGRSARVLAASRPQAPIMMATADPRIERMGSLLWGTIPTRVTPQELEDPHAVARRLVLRSGLADPGQTILIVRGFGIEPAANEPSVTIMKV